jgi:pSer/pThr/pTyr-binding forkhead associated (FHA) protein
MATTTRFPQPAGPFSADPVSDRQATHPIDSELPEVISDALGLLDHQTHARTIRPEFALRGSYLGFEDRDEIRLLALDDQVTHIGRGADAHVRIDQHHVSRDHAILVRHGRYFRLLDNRSANGTFLNGRRVVATNVADGDVIRVGPVAMRFFEVR